MTVEKLSAKNQARFDKLKSLNVKSEMTFTKESLKLISFTMEKAAEEEGASDSFKAFANDIKQAYLKTRSLTSMNTITVRSSGLIGTNLLGGQMLVVESGLEQSTQTTTQTTETGQTTEQTSQGKSVDEIYAELVTADEATVAEAQTQAKSILQLTANQIAKQYGPDALAEATEEYLQSVDRELDRIIEVVDSKSSTEHGSKTATTVINKAFPKKANKYY